MHHTSALQLHACMQVTARARPVKLLASSKNKVSVPLSSGSNVVIQIWIRS